MAHGLSSSAACGIFLDQGSNPRLLHWQVGSSPLSHQGSLQMGLYSRESNPLSLLLIQGKTHSSLCAISFLKLFIQKSQIPENSRGAKFCLMLAASRLIPFSEELHGIKQTGNVRLLSNPLSSSPNPNFTPAPELGSLPHSPGDGKCTGSLAVAHRAYLLCGTWGSSWTRDQTHVSCTGQRILNPWTTREVLCKVFNVLVHLSL